MFLSVNGILLDRRLYPPSSLSVILHLKQSVPFLMVCIAVIGILSQCIPLLHEYFPFPFILVQSPALGFYFSSP